MSAPPERHPADGLTLAELRTELRHLIALADSAERPKPTRINPAGHAMPGHEWEINQRVLAKNFQTIPTWLVRTVDESEVADAVYVSSPDCTHPTDDFIAMPTEDARRLAMALLAAADRADHTALGITRLEDSRKPQSGR
ncbi:MULTISPECIES: hypothetical protein [unclassified Streptomyces]|uniref:hypothetical protein n=1 Tax=unclassified Streptomyces TaxID=2593676 RepID=UPI00081D4806|nr:MULTISPECIES: hypothetical protein [unclassified Streptomyces]MYZ34344.1 hypothetical protein [Streptomyces sp. SID4917]SCF66622.1 hypothetical protein GA0115259_100849 [Streptomyces sp. MnatMP-M17]